MSFNHVCTSAAILFISLSSTLLLLPEIVYWLFGLQQDDLGDFLAKRAGALFFGFSIMCFLARHTDNLELQRVVAMTVSASMCAMAFIGMYELFRGYAGFGILIAIIIEIVICVVFYRTVFIEDNSNIN